MVRYSTQNKNKSFNKDYQKEINLNKMSNVHEKMQTDYLWLRDHSTADDWVKARYNMVWSLIYHFSEPMVITIYTPMSPTKEKDLKWSTGILSSLNIRKYVHRSMGRQHDWELEKFRVLWINFSLWKSTWIGCQEVPW